MANNVVIFGLGPNCKNKYLNYCFKLHQQGVINIVAFVDLASEQQRLESDLASYLKENKITQIPLFCIPNNIANSVFQESCHSFLSNLFQGFVINKAIIATEPKGHLLIALWCLQNNIDVFMDKPISAFYELSDYKTLMSDFQLMQSVAQDKGLEFVICSQKRSHVGYQLLCSKIDEISDKMQQKVTYIDIHYGGGNCVTFDEFTTKENHPYKYGYGIILHSGYHYVDLLARLISKCFSSQDFDSINFDFQVTYLAIDHKHLNNNINYIYGESDVLIQGKAYDDKQNVVLFSLKLLDTSISLRKLEQMHDECYSSFGRLRQENIIIHMGHIASLYLRSLPLKKIDGTLEYENFDIDIILIDPKLANHQLEQIDRKQLNIDNSQSLNKSASIKQLAGFLTNQKSVTSSVTSIETHKNTIYLIEKIYQNIYNSKIKKAA